MATVAIFHVLGGFRTVQATLDERLNHVGMKVTLAWLQVVAFLENKPIRYIKFNTPVATNRELVLARKQLRKVTTGVASPANSDSFP